MSTYSDLRDALVARINTVANIGLVHNRERYSSNWTDYLAQFASTISSQKQVRGWWVTWDGIPAAWEDGSAFGRIAEQYVFTVRGVQGMDDSANTEGTFGDLIEAVKAAIRNQASLSVAGVESYSIIVTVPTLELRQFGSVLCHYAELRVVLTVIQAISYA